MSFNFVTTTSSVSYLKVTVLHVRWKAILPNSVLVSNPSSTPFRFLDKDWTLSIQCHGTSRDLYLVSENTSAVGNARPLFEPLVASSTFAEPFVVTVHVESATTGQVLQALTSTTRINIEVSSIAIWKRSTMEIERASPEFKAYSELKFILVFEATGNNSTSALSSSVPQTTSNVPCLESLSKDFSKLLEQGQNNPDIEFQCGGKSTKAHGDVVSSRSQVIAKMLATDMVEGRTKVVKIPDLKPDIFEKFLRYLYTGKLDELTFEVALDLFEAGDQYAVTGLAKRCSEYLVEHLSMQNACAVLVIANSHSNESLVEKVVDYMVDNRVPVASEDWPAFCDEHPRLANKVLNRGWKAPGMK